jgi:peptidoglycan hydrolase-like protein with peptidoglycan-binding domain
MAPLALMLIGLAGPLQAQTPPPQVPAEIAALYANVPPAVIARLQEDLVFAAGFTGAVDGVLSVRTVEAVRALQGRLSKPQTGFLAPDERAVLQRQADTRRAELGWQVVQDRASSARIGLPTKLLGPAAAGGPGRTIYAARDGSLRIEVFQLPQTGIDLAQLYEREKTPTPARQPTYSLIKGDFFAIGGNEQGRRYDMRVVVREGIARGFLANYDPRLAASMGPVLIAMAGAFQPFATPAAPGPAPAPGAPPVAGAPLDRPLAALPAPASNLLYGTATVVSPQGDLITSARLVEKCETVAVGRLGYAAVVGRDPATDLAHLKVYGRTDLQAFGLAAEVPKVGDAVAVAARPHPARKPEGLDTANGRIEDTRPNGRALVAAPFATGNHGGAVVTPDLRLAAVMVGPPGNMIQVAGGPPPPSVVVAANADRIAALLARAKAKPEAAGALFINGPLGADSAAMFRALDQVVVPVACMLKK